MAIQTTITTKTPTPEGYNAELSSQHQKRYDNERQSRGGGVDGIKKQNNTDNYGLKDSALSIARRSAMAGMSGGVGKAMDKAVQGVAYEGLAAGAQRASRLARMRRARRLRENRALRQTQKPKGKKMSGVSFWLVVGCTLLKDALDPLLHLTVILSFLIIFVGLCVTFITLFYLFYNKVKFDSRKLASFALTAVVEIIPIISILPMATVNLFLIRYFENKKSKKSKKFISRAASFAKRYA